MGEQEIMTLESEGQLGVKLSEAGKRQRKLEENMKREEEQRRKKRMELLQREQEYEKVTWQISKTHVCLFTV